MGRAGQVEAPRRRGDPPGVARALHGAPDVGEDRGDPLVRHVQARQPGHLGGGEVDRRDGPDVRQVGGLPCAASAVFDEQVDHPLRCHGGQLGVHAALEALRGLAGQLVAAGGPGDGDRVEVGGFDEHVDRRLGDLGVRAAHDAGDPQDALGAAVGDEQILGVQGAFDAVEGRVPLPRPSAADDDRPAQPAEVVGVQRLAEIEHDVVRRVHGQGDRPHPRGGQAVAQPLRALRRRVDPPDDAGDETVAADVAVDRRAVSHLDGEAVGHGRRDRSVEALRQAGVGEGRAGRMMVFAGDPAHGEAVAAIRRDVDLQGPLTEPEVGERVLPHGREPGGGLGVARGGQDDDPVLVLAQAELAHRADHAVGEVSVRLARGDGKSPGQDGARKGDHDVVADVEVVGAADDAARGEVARLLAGSGGVVVLADVDPAVVDDLAVLVLLGLPGEDPAHDDRPGDVGGVDRLLLQADPDEGGREAFGRQAGGQLHVGAEPFDGYERHVSAPFLWFRTGGRSARPPPPCRGRRRCRGGA